VRFTIAGGPHAGSYRFATGQCDVLGSRGEPPSIISMFTPEMQKDGGADPNSPTSFELYTEPGRGKPDGLTLTVEWRSCSSRERTIGDSWYGLTSTSVPTASTPPTPPISEAIASAANMDQGHRIAAVDNSLRAIEDADRAVARDRRDPKYVVETVGRKPNDLSAWVRDSTTWIPYRGQLRGPTGVLMDRLGNSLARALVLAALLEASGQTVSLGHAELSREQATDLLPRLVPDGSRDTSPILDVPPRQTSQLRLRNSSGPLPRGTGRRHMPATAAREVGDRRFTEIGAPS
jgi:hypothetical protein